MAEKFNTWHSKIFLKILGRKTMFDIENAQYFLNKKDISNRSKSTVDKLQEELNFCVISSIGLSLVLRLAIQKTVPYYRTRVNLATMSIDLIVIFLCVAGGITFAINSCSKDIQELTKEHILELNRDYLIQMQLYSKKYGITMYQQIQPYLSRESAEKWTFRATEILA